MGKERVSIPTVKFLAEGVQQEIKPPDSDKGKGCWFLERQEGEKIDLLLFYNIGILELKIDSYDCTKYIAFYDRSIKRLKKKRERKKRGKKQKMIVANILNTLGEWKMNSTTFHGRERMGPAVINPVLPVRNGEDGKEKTPINVVCVASIAIHPISSSLLDLFPHYLIETVGSRALAKPPRDAI
ncbi:hypothetical protein EAG_06502 [Camponotus floridanus]|uniref:Uncharacterized protein n=1 Tax=Camponotus floridanus TaxID=104421 RepID=E1ZYG1_CAMFO|nr:hypothetical protein EAG_06502 [Camponotus floridanus]